MPEDYR